MHEMIYRERDGGTWKYWTYCDGDRVYISANEADKMQRQGAAITHANAPRESLTRAISRSIARGAPIFTNQD